jgi:hypothetical protein
LCSGSSSSPGLGPALSVSFLEHYYNIHIARRSSRALATGSEEAKQVGYVDGVIGACQPRIHGSIPVDAAASGTRKRPVVNVNVRKVAAKDLFVGQSIE